MTVQLVVILLGIISSCTLLISALSVHRNRLLGFAVITGLLVAIEYGLLGSWSGFVSVAIGLGWTLVTVGAARYPGLKQPLLVPVFITGQALAFWLTTDWRMVTPLGFVPLIGGIGGIIAVYLTDVLRMKAIFILCGIAWLGYEFTTGAYGQLVGESINLVANTVAFAALLTARRRGIPASMLQDLDTQLIETITGAIGVVTKPAPVLNYDLYPQHTLRGSKKPIRGAHPQSVGYARLSAEYDLVRQRLHADFVRKFELMDEREKPRV